MQIRWLYLLAPSLIITLSLLVASQFIFITRSFYSDLGLGEIGDVAGFGNYMSFFTDPFYVHSLWLTIKVSAIAALLTLILAYPVAYILARMKSRWSMYLLAGVVVSSFISVIIKVFGIILIFSSGGWLNRALLVSGIVNEPITIIGNLAGVVIGLMHYCFGFAVLLLYTVVQTIPQSLEDAAQLHGSNRLRVLARIVFPLSLPGVLIGGLTLFNLNAGAFTSAAVLGGGRIFTLPVLIQHTVIFESRYAMAGTISAILLFTVIAINMIAVLSLRRFCSTEQF